VLQAKQIVSFANINAKTPGFATQAGLYLNVILAELAQLNDFELSKGLFQINTSSPTGVSPTSGIPYYNLATDHLHVLGDGVFYLVNGVPYNLIQKDQSDFDSLITTTGFNAQMVFFTIDDSTTPSTIAFWPPSNAAYTVNIRYAKQRADIVSPETSTVVPWFPLQQYLIDELSARMMSISDDDRKEKFHERAARMLSKWLTMQRDLESTTLRVKLDRDRFGSAYDQLRNTKTVGF
jgi:hypothetical protein